MFEMNIPLPGLSHDPTGFKARVGGCFSSEINRWSLIQLINIVPIVGVNPKFASPPTFSQFTSAVSVGSDTV